MTEPVRAHPTRSGSAIPTLLTLALGVLSIVLASQVPPARLDNDPGPALLPQVAGAGLVVFSLFLLWRRTPHEDLPRGDALFRVVATAVLALVYALLIEPMGFPVATALFLGAEMYLVGVRRLVLLFPAAVLLSLGIYVLFRYGLEVPLPGTRIGGLEI